MVYGRVAGDLHWRLTCKRSIACRSNRFQKRRYWRLGDYSNTRKNLCSLQSARNSNRWHINYLIAKRTDKMFDRKKYEIKNCYYLYIIISITKQCLEKIMVFRFTRETITVKVVMQAPLSIDSHTSLYCSNGVNFISFLAHMTLISQNFLFCNYIMVLRSKKNK